MHTWLLSFFPLVASRLLHSLPDDTYALPKYRVTFLNGLPVQNATATTWLKEGLRGGEREFLDQLWNDESPPSSRREIGSGGDQKGPAVDVCTTSSLKYPHTLNVIILSCAANIHPTLLIPLPGVHENWHARLILVSRSVTTRSTSVVQ